MIGGWRPVPGYEGVYWVSSRGAVWSKNTGKCLKPSETHDGYAQVNLSRSGVKKHWYVHSLVLTVFQAPKPNPETVARHLNGDPRDNRSENLKWGTQKENVADSLRHGTNKERRKTHCPWGHLLTGSNVYITSKGHRNCRSCGRARGRLADPNKNHVGLANEIYQELKQVEKESENG